MKKKLIYRGINLNDFSNIKTQGIPKGSVFTTDYLWAKKHGKVIAIPFSKSGLKPTKDNITFKRLKINEKYFVTIKQRKKFTKIGEL